MQSWFGVSELPSPSASLLRFCPSCQLLVNHGCHPSIAINRDRENGTVLSPQKRALSEHEDRTTQSKESASLAWIREFNGQRLISISFSDTHVMRSQARYSIDHDSDRHL